MLQTEPSTRFRFRLRTPLLLPAAFAVGFLALTTISPIGCGYACPNLRFRIVDDVTGRPIPGADVMSIYCL